MTTSTTQRKAPIVITTETPGGISFHHDTGMAGDVLITDLPADAVTVDPRGKPVVRIPFEDLRFLVLQHLATKMIRRLEDADTDELERLLTR